MDATKAEYELQHFNFTADDIINENRTMVRSSLQQAIVHFTDLLIEKQSVPLEAAMQLRSQSYTISAAIFDDCAAPMDALTELYRSTFAIPDNVLLPTDHMQEKRYTAEDVDILQQKVEELKTQMMQNAVFLAALEEEEKLHGALEQCYDAEEGTYEQLKHFHDVEVLPDEVDEIVERLRRSGLLANTGTDS